MRIDSMHEIKNFHQENPDLKHLPYFRVTEGIANNHITINQRRYINYSTYNYLGLNGHQRIIEEVTKALKTYGTTVSGSRIIGGEIALHQQLEQKIANFIGTEASLVQVGGHSTNVNIIGQMVTHSDLVLCDSLSHNSILQGIKLSGAKVMRFKHNNMVDLQMKLETYRDRFERVLIVVEGVYSMDGDVCNLPDLITLKKQYHCLLMIDEAHSIGTIGDGGRGVTSFYGIHPAEVDVLMGTLSKSLNSCGGYIAGSKAFINYLKYNCPGFVFSVGISPANTVAAHASLEIIEECPELVYKLHQNASYFLMKLKAIGVDTGLSANSPIIPLIVGTSEATLSLSQRLYDQGVNVMPIIFPAVKESSARLRFFISAAHTIEDMDQTIEILKQEL